MGNIYYKSVRCIDGRPKWVIEDEYGNIINRNPTKEQIISTTFKNITCYICGTNKTHIYQGKPQWRRYLDKNGNIKENLNGVDI